MGKYKESSVYQQQGSVDRLVCDRSSRLNSSNTARPYSPWNKPNVNGFRHWGSSVDRSSFRLKVHNGQDNVLNYCINCGHEPKPDQWAGPTSRLCMDCGDVA